MVPVLVDAGMGELTRYRKERGGLGAKLGTSLEAWWVLLGKAKTHPSRLRCCACAGEGVGHQRIWGSSVNDHVPVCVEKQPIRIMLVQGNILKV